MEVNNQEGTQDRIRLNVTTNAKGNSQFDVTVEIFEADPGRACALLAETLERAMVTAVAAGFPVAEPPVKSTK